LYYSYFINEVTEYEPLKEQFAQPRPNAHSSPPLQVGHSGCGVKAKKFRQVRLPLFLGGQMHALRLSGSTQEARKIYEATKASAIFDKKLKMYKITACLKDAPQEIGRCHEFPSGWLEHESIWLHMEYKYLLELLKAGLYREFYSDFKNALIPFQPPERYGRSILENSSFLVGSAFADKNLHGNGFVARLSGSTAEFIQMWLMMNLGAQPFLLDSNGKLSFCLRPALAGWLFDRKGMYSFKLMSKIDLAYHNPKRKDTFGKDGVKVQRIVLRDKDNSAVEIKNNTIPSPYAQQVRARLISRIDAYLE
jgi:hypothetical protein